MTERRRNEETYAEAFYRRLRQEWSADLSVGFIPQRIDIPHYPNIPQHIDMSQHIISPILTGSTMFAPSGLVFSTVSQPIAQEDRTELNKEITSMELYLAIRVLKEAGVDIALDVGEHAYCKLDSNCPLAIRLRRFIEEAKISPEDLARAVEAQTFSFREPPLPDVKFESKIVVSWPGSPTELELDFSHMMDVNIRAKIQEKLSQLDHYQTSLLNYSRRLQSAYSQAVIEAKRTRSLTQLSFRLEEMHKEGCVATGFGNYYQVTFPVKYAPKYLITNSYRYEIESPMAAKLERDLLLLFTIHVDNFFESTKLVSKDLRKFVHYHGNSSEDCWGNIVFPRWDGSFRQLVNLRNNLMGSLATINLNSLMTAQPRGFPSTGDLKDLYSKLLGREGVLKKEDREQIDTTQRWGREEDEEEEEYARTMPDMDPLIHRLEEVNMVAPAPTQRTRWGVR